jgi:hypothetical protein
MVWLPVSYQPRFRPREPVKDAKRTAAPKGKADAQPQGGSLSPSPPPVSPSSSSPYPPPPPPAAPRSSRPARIHRRVLLECGWRSARRGGVDWASERRWAASRASIPGPTTSAATPSRAAAAGMALAPADGPRPRPRPRPSVPGTRGPWWRRASRSPPQVRSFLRSAFSSVGGWG